METLRKPLSKKVRFETFKRDLFCCQYCGRKPPSVALEVDHITPVTKGGKNNVDNLLTSCFDCNRGKSNIELSSLPPSTEEKLLLLKEKRDQYKEYQKYSLSMDKMMENDLIRCDKVWLNHFMYPYDSSFRNSSIKTFIRKLGVEEVITSMELALSRKGDRQSKAIPYFCGICWNKINDTTKNG